MQKTYCLKSRTSDQDEKMFVVSYAAYHHLNPGKECEFDNVIIKTIKEHPILMRVMEHKVSKLTYELSTAKISTEEFIAQMTKYEETEPEMLNQYKKDIMKLSIEPIYSDL